MFGQLFKNMPDVVKNLLIINLLFFVAQNMISTFDYYFSLYPISSDFFKPWQLATHFFMHANIPHIFFNMFALVIFGSQLEKIWGPKRFLTYYFITAIGAAFLHLTVNYIRLISLESSLPDDIVVQLIQNGPVQYYNPTYNEFVGMYHIPMMGASGAVFGLLAAFGYLFPNTELMLLFPPIPIKAKYFVIGYAAIELYLGVANNPNDNVAHFAHLGGALIGILLVLYWNKNRNSFF
ncbi:MAG: rhomboid family intramembrane serine protease [Crocinitomicaceae bacterium]|nr:rhomboid family intramembrane serine protease [Crocinitomicaceae bacterium]|tara:strand:- start:2130 stop:2837 length:708 start_codon:yes stop_codon:yes gene_type:complete